jgi:hypothetical protein
MPDLDVSGGVLATQGFQMGEHPGRSLGMKQGGVYDGLHIAGLGGLKA